MQNTYTFVLFNALSQERFPLVYIAAQLADGNTLTSRNFQSSPAFTARIIFLKVHAAGSLRNMLITKIRAPIFKRIIIILYIHEWKKVFSFMREKDI